MRIGATINSHTFENYDDVHFNIDDESGNGVISVVPTIDYYLNDDVYRPYLGLGVGAYLLASYLDVYRVAIANPSEEKFEVNVNNQIGFLLRAGFESKKSRLGVEYNFAPKADIEIPNGQIIGTVANNYFGLSIGFTIASWKSSD